MSRSAPKPQACLTPTAGLSWMAGQCWSYPLNLPGAGPPHRAARPRSGRGGLCVRPSCPRVGVLSGTTLPSEPLAIFALGRAHQDLLTHHQSSQFTWTKTKAHRWVHTCPRLPTTSWADPVWDPSLKAGASFPPAREGAQGKGFRKRDQWGVPSGCRPAHRSSP